MNLRQFIQGLRACIEAGVGITIIAFGMRLAFLMLRFLSEVVTWPEAAYTNKMLFLLLGAFGSLTAVIFLTLKLGSQLLTAGIKRFRELLHKPRTEQEEPCGKERPQRKTLCQRETGHAGSCRAVIYWEAKE